MPDETGLTNRELIFLVACFLFIMAMLTINIVSEYREERNGEKTEKWHERRRLRVRKLFWVTGIGVFIFLIPGFLAIVVHEEETSLVTVPLIGVVTVLLGGMFEDILEED